MLELKYERLQLSTDDRNTQMNISEVEYATKYENYLQTVRENRRLRQQRDTYTTTQRFQSYAHFGTQTLDTPYSKLLHPVNLSGVVLRFYFFYFCTYQRWYSNYGLCNVYYGCLLSAQL
ncbi:hypothetical protein J6590_073376 [Homalodisca vitripennis]|nr:hypothetical protein J6590_073376 [Homalodisca vitripennis]